MVKKLKQLIKSY